MPAQTTRAIAAAGVAVLACHALVVAQSRLSTEQWSIVDHRPLYPAVHQLVLRHGWQVTYEDNYSENLHELQDIGWKLAVPGRRMPPRLLAAPETRLELDYAKEATRDAVITALLAAYHQSGHGDEYRAECSGPMLHVIPSMSRDAGGVPRERRSRLDVRVTVAAANRHVRDFVQAVLDAVGRASGQAIQVLEPMGNAGQRVFDATFDEPVRNESAQQAIERALASTGDRYAWLLLCGAGPGASCALNLLWIPADRRVVID
jgi:hypothetical protein